MNEKLLNETSREIKSIGVEDGGMRRATSQGLDGYMDNLEVIE